MIYHVGLRILPRSYRQAPEDLCVYSLDLSQAFSCLNYKKVTLSLWSSTFLTFIAHLQESTISG